MRFKRRSQLQVHASEPRSARLALIRFLYVSIVLALALWLGNLLFGDKLYLRSEGLVLGEPAVVAAEFPVTVRKIVIHEGETVKTGEAAAIVTSQTVIETIARLASDIAGRVIRQSELRIRKEVIATMIPFAEHRQQFASGARKQLESLIDRGYLSLNQQSAALETEYRGVQDFQTLKSEEHAIDSELITLGAALAEAQSAIDELRGIYDAGRLTSPIDGVVTRIASNKGSVLRAGEPLIELSGNQRFILAYLPTGALYSVHEGDKVTINTGLRSTYGIISKVEPFAAALPREFQRAFTPVERQQVIRIEFSAGEVPPPLFTKVLVGGSSAAREWVEKLARRWQSAT